MLIDKDGKVRGMAACHSTRIGGNVVVPTDTGPDSLAREFEEFQQFQNFKATKKVVATTSRCCQPFTPDMLQY